MPGHNLRPTSMTRISIWNFKAIEHLDLTLTPFTLLIGGNACGKSTVLQAIDLLCSLAYRDVDEYLHSQGWTIDDIKSQFCNKDEPIRFSVDFCIGIDATIPTLVQWDIEINYVNHEWSVTEHMVDKQSGEKYLVYENETVTFGNQPSFPAKLKSSALKVFIPKGDLYNAQNSIWDINSFLSNSMSLGLLVPYAMRQNDGSVQMLGTGNGRIAKYSLGRGGEMLATCVHSMTEDEQHELCTHISSILGYEVKLSTTANESTGQVELYLEEMWNGKKTTVKKQHISDGLLRLIVLATILSAPAQFMSFQGVVLLDEIEDGINPELVEKIVQLFEVKASKRFSSQIVITTHSPVVLNYVTKENIQYLWREKSGNVKAKALFSSPELNEYLDFLNPGEVWLNYSNDEIVDFLNDAETDK
jgi:predicted ATPase